MLSVLCQCEHMNMYMHMYMCVSEMRAQHNAKPTCAHVCTVRTIHSRTGLCIHTFTVCTSTFLQYLRAISH
jgi:hypothetical protein